MERKGNPRITNIDTTIICSNTPKVSIVVPIHNAGEYLKLCLDSLKQQTLHDIEFILVLDCPTDGSDKMAEEYATNDARFRLIYNKENLHTGCSRNEGIKHAQGEYVGFADHDDYCDPEMFEKLYSNAISESADVVISNYYDEYLGVQTLFAFPEGFSAKEFQENAFLALVSGYYSIRNSQSFNNMNVIWNQIYKRSLLLENEIFFPDNRKLTLEDVYFSLKVYHFASKVSYLPATYYHHVNTSNNNYNNYSYHSISRMLPLIEEISVFLTQNNILQKYKNEFTVCTLKRIYSSFRNELKFKKLNGIIPFICLVRSNNVVQKILLNFSENKSLLKKFAITKVGFYYLISKQNSD